MKATPQDTTWEELMKRERTTAMSYLTPRVGVDMAETIIGTAEAKLKSRLDEPGFVARVSLSKLLTDLVESQCFIYRVQMGKSVRKAAMREVSIRYRQSIKRKWLNRLPKSEADDLASQAIVALVENVLDGRFGGRSSLGTYLDAIARNLGKKYWTARKRTEQYRYEGVADEFEPDPETIYMDKELKQMVQVTMKRLGEKCRKILRMWMLRYRMKEIAEELSYANESVVRNTKKRCMQSLVQIIETDPDLRNTLNELL